MFKKRVLPLLLAVMLIMPFAANIDVPQIKAAEPENIAYRRQSYSSLYQNTPAMGSSAANSSWSTSNTATSLPSYDETAMLVTDGIIDVANPLDYPKIEAMTIDGTPITSSSLVQMIDGQNSASGSVTPSGTLSESNPLILKLTLPKAEKVTEYSLLPHSGNYTVGNAPHTWKLQASKTGGIDPSEWVDIDSFAAYPDTLSSTIPVQRATSAFNGKDLRFTDLAGYTGIYSYGGHSQGNGGVQRKTTADDYYKYYRLSISKRNAGTSGTISLADIAFYSGDSTRNLMRAPFISRWKSTPNANQWIYVDLGEDVSYDSLKLHWGNDSYPTEYTVEVSNDVTYNYGNGGTSSNDGTVYPNTWTQIAAKSKTTGGTDEVTFSTQTARYVRINMSSRVDGSSDYKLYEFEVYGTRSAAPYENPARPAAAADGTQKLTGGDWTIARAESMTETGEQLSSPTFDDSDWLPAKVPGTALMSYVKAGVIPDPNFDMNMMFISDTYFYSDWWYRTSFDIPADKLGQKTFLNFDGINWKAKVYVNGHAVSDERYDIEGAFIRSKIDISAYANVGGKNYIAVRVYPPARYATAHTKSYSTPNTNGGLLGADNPTFHANANWDWIPTIRGRSTGIYDDVFVSYSGKYIQLIDPWVVTEFDKIRDFSDNDLMSDITPSDDPAYDFSVAHTTLKVEVKNTHDDIATSLITGVYQPGNITFSKTVTIPPHSTVPVNIPVDIPNPEIWWPNGYGDQPLYTAEVEIAGSDAKTFRFGVRQLAFTYTGSESLYTQSGNYDSRNGYDTAVNVYCNGVRIFLRGGNWGMDDSNVDLSYEDYRVRLKLHAEENFTMIRNWVGMTMKEEFYDACDEYGLLIWDDFWLANPWDGPDPIERDMFIKNAEDKVRVARKHPSLALYCARNESPVPRPLDTGIQNAIETLDGTRIYVRSSDASVWGISGHGDYTEQERKAYYNGMSQSGVGSRQPGSTPQLHTERGQHVIANPEVLTKYFRPENLWPGFGSASSTAHPWRQNVVAANVWGVHDFFMGGNGPASNFFTQLTAYASMSDLDSYYNSLEDFSRVSQLANYDLHRSMFEAFTDIKSSGLLMWMSQSAWPSFAWRSYDYYYDTSAAYFGIKKASAPLTIIWNPTNGAAVSTISSGRLYNPYPGGISVANNTGKVLTDLKAIAKIYNIDGTLAKEVDLADNGIITKLSVDEVMRLNTEGNGTLWPTEPVSSVRFLKLELFDKNGELVADNFYWRSNSETGTTATGTAATNYYTSMRTMPVVSVDTKATIAGSDANSNYYDVLVENNTSSIAMQVRLKTTDPDTGEMILPVYYEDNYFCLLPGESKVVSVDIEKLYFDDIPDFSVSGYNVNKAPVEIVVDADYDSTMASFTFGGKTFTAQPGVVTYDVNLTNDVSSVSFDTTNVTPNYPEDVSVSVVLTPNDGTTPCEAIITIASNEYPRLIKSTYTVSFGHMTVTSLTGKYDSDSGFDAKADIRFSDGATKFKLIYALYKDNSLIFVQSFLKDEIALHGSETISYNIPSSVIEPFGDNVTMKLYLWDQNYTPLTSAWSWFKSDLVETEVYKLVPNAAAIKAGEEYVIVSDAPGSRNKALTNTSVSVPVGCLNSNSVTVDGDYITGVIADMVWETSTAVNGGLYFKNLSAVTYYGGGQEYLARRSSASGNPVALTTTVDDGNAAYNRWSFSDVSTADSTIAMYTTASTSSSYYILDPQTAGFYAFYGSAANGQATDSAARPLKFYVKTTEMRPAK